MSLQNQQNGEGTKVILSGSLSAPLGSHPPLPAAQADVAGRCVWSLGDVQDAYRRGGLDLSFVFPFISVLC